MNTIDKFEDFSIKAKGKVPYYYQVYLYLEKKLLSQEFKDGEKLPNELQLCDKFHLSRTTIRDAFKDLELKGYIYRSRGHGTYVSKKKSEPVYLSKILSIEDELRNSKVSIKVEILEKKIIEVSEDLQDKLLINRKSRILFIKRLTSAGGKPLILSRAYLSGNIFKKIEDDQLVNNSFVKIVHENLGINTFNQIKILEPEVPNKEIIKLFDISENDKKAVIRIETFWSYMDKSDEKKIYFVDYFSKYAKFIFN